VGLGDATSTFRAPRSGEAMLAPRAVGALRDATAVRGAGSAATAVAPLEGAACFGAGAAPADAGTGAVEVRSRFLGTSGDEDRRGGDTGSAAPAAATPSTLRLLQGRGHATAGICS
jgi:hypothetical protein